MGKITNKLKLVPLEAHFFVDQHTKNPRSELLRDFFLIRLIEGRYKQICAPKPSVFYLTSRDVAGAKYTTKCGQI